MLRFCGHFPARMACAYESQPTHLRAPSLLTPRFVRRRGVRLRKQPLSFESAGALL